MEIYFKALEIYFSATEIYFKATEIVLLPAPVILNTQKNLEFCLLIRIFAQQNQPETSQAEA